MEYIFKMPKGVTENPDSIQRGHHSKIKWNKDSEKTRAEMTCCQQTHSTRNAKQCSSGWEENYVRHLQNRNKKGKYKRPLFSFHNLLGRQLLV